MVCANDIKKYGGYISGDLLARIIDKVNGLDV
jgi:hypothetical protein